MDENEIAPIAVEEAEVESNPEPVAEDVPAEASVAEIAPEVEAEDPTPVEIPVGEPRAGDTAMSSDGGAVQETEFRIQ